MRIFPLLSLALLLAAGPLSGQAVGPDAPAQDNLKEELRWLRAESFRVVTASKFEQKYDDAPAKMVVWTREMIRRNGFQTLEEVLEHTPGFYCGFNSDYALYSVRGMSPLAPGMPQPNILFMIDGIRLNEATFFGHYYNYCHNLDNVEQIEIILGPGGALYGLNALSGVVHIITRRPPKERSASFETSASVETPLNDGSFFLGGSWNGGGDCSVYASLSLPYSINGRWDTGVANLGAVDWYRKSPWHHGLERSGSCIPNWDVRFNFRNLEFFLYRASIQYPEFNAPWWDITAERTRSFEKRICEVAWKPGPLDAEIKFNFNQHYDFHDSQGRTLWADFGQPPGNSTWGLTQVNEYLLSAQATPLRQEHNNVLAAIEISRANRNADFLGDPDGRSLDQWRCSVLAQWENKSISNLTVLAGFRYDYVSIESHDPAQNAAKVIDHFDALSPRLSLSYRLGEAHRVRLVLARAYRQFILGDFIDPVWAHQPDYVDDIEFDYKFNFHKHFSADVNFFHMRAPYTLLAINDNFFPPEGRTPFKSYGIEANVDARFGDVEMSGGVTWWHARTGQLEEAGVERMLNVPRVMIKFNLRAPLVADVLHLAVLVNGNVGFLHMDDLSGAYREEWGYAPVNVILSSGRRLRPYTFSFGVKNLFNQRFDYPGYGCTAPFRDWNYPGYMVTDSRVKHPGISAFAKFGIEF